MLQCGDGTLYVGATADLSKRMHQHNYLKSGARYTRQRRPVVLVHQEEFVTLREARRREYELKQLTRAEKLKLLEQGQQPFSPF